MILFALLPPLLFESAYGVDFHVFEKVFPMALIMAGPGVLVASLLTMLAIKALLSEAVGHDLGYWASFLLGSILSATDPVAVSPPFPAVLLLLDKKGTALARDNPRS